MLTDITCKTLTSLARKNKKRLKKADADGLFLYAMPNGKAYWRHKYYFQGKEKQISYGRYPLVSLSEARQKRDNSRQLLQQGKDPSKARQDEAKAALRLANNTFKAVALQWYNHNLGQWSERYAYKVMRCLLLNLFPSIGHVPVNELSRKQLLEAIRQVEEREAFEPARRALGYAEHILTYAQNNEYVEVNVALGLKKSLKYFKRGHFPSMDIDMLPEFVRKLDRNEAGLSQNVKDMIEVLMLTLVRPSELINAEWQEIDFTNKLWTISAAKMKMRLPHLVPLSPAVINILQRRKAASELEEWRKNSKYVFPSPMKPDKSMHLTTLSESLSRMGYKNIHCPHGFRALGMGIAKEKLGYRHEIPDRQLSHAPKGTVNRAYDRAKFLPERVEMMNRLAGYIEELRRPAIREWAFTLKKSATSVQAMPYNYTISLTANAA